MLEISEILSKQNDDFLSLWPHILAVMQAKDMMGCGTAKEVLKLLLFWWQLAFTSTGRWLVHLWVPHSR